MAAYETGKTLPGYSTTSAAEQAAAQQAAAQRDQVARDESARQQAAYTAAVKAAQNPGGLAVNATQNPTGTQATFNPLTGTSGLNATTPYGSTQQYQTTPGGGTVASQLGSMSQPGYEGQQDMQLQSLLAAKQAETAHGYSTSDMDHEAALQAAAEQRRLGYLSTLRTSGGPAGPTGGAPAFDETAARAAAFAAAKEQAGQTANASLRALGDVMASRGMTGSSVEGAGISDVVNGARGGVNAFTTDQLISDLNRASGVADRNYQGGIQMRGQDMAQLPSLMSLITAKGGGVY